MANGCGTLLTITDRRLLPSKLAYLKSATETFFNREHTIIVGLLIAVTSVLGFKARLDPLFSCFLACVHWIPHICLWCNTCWMYSGQHGTQAFLTHILTNVSRTEHSTIKGAGAQYSAWLLPQKTLADKERLSTRVKIINCYWSRTYYNLRLYLHTCVSVWGRG